MFLFQHLILTFFFKTTHQPLNTSNVEDTKSIRKTSPFVIRDVFKMLLILKDIMRFHSLLCFNVLTFFYSKISHSFFQKPHIHQKRQNDVMLHNMNIDASPKTYGGICLGKVRCLSHQRIGLK